ENRTTACSIGCRSACSILPASGGSSSAASIFLRCQRFVAMLVDLSRAVGSYLHDVFVIQLDWWIALGFLAQALFTMRFAVQWIASERAGRSVVPMAFWLFSIGGGILLLVYA